MRRLLFPFALVLAACGGNGDGIEAAPDGGQGVPGTLSEWTNHLKLLPHALNDVLWDGDVFIAVGSKGAILTSADGIDWVTRESGTEANLTTVAAHGTDIIVVGEAIVLLSTDHGANWVTKNIPIGTGLYTAAMNSSQVVGYGWAGDALGNGIMISEDRGETWQAIDWNHDTDTWFGNPGLTDITFQDGLFVAVADSDVFAHREGWVFVSTDGTVWDEVFNCPFGLALVVHTGNQFIVAGRRSGAVFSSFDGFNWTEIQTPLNGIEFLSAASDGNRLMLAGGYPCWSFDNCSRPESPIPIGVISTDGGMSWDTFNIDGYYQSRGLAFGNGRFVSVGNATPNGSAGGAIYTAE